jgi:hypothetical protein
VAELADAAVSIWEGSRTIPGYTRTDLAEDLKRHAAQRRIEYFDGLRGANGIIEQAMAIAEQRRKAPG